MEDTPLPCERAANTLKLMSVTHPHLQHLEARTAPTALRTTPLRTILEEESVASAINNTLVRTYRNSAFEIYSHKLDRGFSIREELPLPSKPPFTAHLGNLSFEVTQADVQDFLSACAVTSVRLVEDKMDRKPKGFGYVEFATLDGLKKALELSGTQFQGRNIRVSVAEPRKHAPGLSLIQQN